MKLQRITCRIATLSLLSVSLLATGWSQQPAPGAGAPAGAPGGAPGGPGGAPGGGPGGPGGGPGGPPAAPDIKFTPFVDIDNGVFKLENADKGKLLGNVTGSEGKDLKIVSNDGYLNTVYVTGAKSNFTLSDSTIETTGDGGNDFAGIGAAIMADAGTTTIKNVKVTTHGVIRPAAVNTGTSVMKVYDSTFTTWGGTLPKDYKMKIGAGMMQPPPPLLIHGTTRAFLTMGQAKTYLYNTAIIADGWGALSTDAAHDAYVECNKCNLQVNKSGYATYADNGATVVINDSKIDSASYGGIIAGSAKMEFTNTQGAAGSNFMMIHSVMGQGPEIGILNIKGGKIMADYDTLLVKSANADISLDGVAMSSNIGNLIHARVNEDSHATKVTADMKITGVRVTMKNEDLEGNLVNDDTDRHMTISFAKSSLKGAIKMAEVSLDADSKWTATGDSKVMLVGNIDIAKIDAPAGVTISAVAGKDCKLSGSYKLASGGSLVIETHPEKK